MADEGVTENKMKTLIIVIVSILILLLILFLVKGWFQSIYGMK